MHLARKREQRSAGSIQNGAFRRRSERSVSAGDEVRSGLDHRRAAVADCARRFQCLGDLVELAGNAHGEARQRVAGNARRRGEHIGRIDSAAEITGHGHVGPQPDLDGASEHGFEPIDRLARVGGVVLVAPIGEVEVPIFALDRRDRLAVLR